MNRLQKRFSDANHGEAFLRRPARSEAELNDKVKWLLHLLAETAGRPASLQEQLFLSIVRDMRWFFRHAALTDPKEVQILRDEQIRTFRELQALTAERDALRAALIRHNLLD